MPPSQQHMMVGLQGSSEVWGTREPEKQIDLFTQENVKTLSDKAKREVAEELGEPWVEEECSMRRRTALNWKQN